MKSKFTGRNPFYLILATGLCLSLLFIHCAGSGPAIALDEITVMQSSVAIGDPHIVSDSVNRLSIINSIYESLVRLDHEGHFQPSLAKSWEVNEDGLTWTFHLRGGVKFHNGETMSAGDVVATMGRVLDPSIGGAFGTQGVFISYLGKAEISATDDMTVQFITPEPMADLLDLIVAMPISPKSALANLPNNYVGSGPYKVLGHGNHKVTLTAHTEYWGTKPQFNKIKWIAEPSAKKRVNALFAGQTDIASGLGIKDHERILKDGQAIARELPSGLCIIFMLNAQKGPCKDRRVRQALNYAIDLDMIIEDIKLNAAEPLNGYLTANHFGYNPETPVYPYMPQKARQLLAESGYEEGLNLTFDIPAIMPNEAPQLAKVIADQLKQVGVTLEIVVHEDRAAYSETVRAKNIYDGCCFDSSPRSTWRVLREKLQSTLQGPWWEGYENKEVNALIEKAAATFDETERQSIYRRIYSIVTEDAPWIFLYRPIRYWGFSNQLKALKLRSDGLLAFN